MTIAPPRPKGPPLNALRAFEAAARLGGFSAAADELCVTPGAITQQVRLLEDYLGAALFDRHARGVRLTPLGGAVQSQFTQVFDLLGEAVQDMRAQAATGKIHIAALPSVAQLWLGPRLPALRARFRQVELSVTALESPPNLKREPFDLSLFFQNAPNPTPGTHSRTLARDVIFPVAAPSIAREIADGADMADFPWLSDTTWSGDWQRWLAAQGHGGPPARGPVYSLYALAVSEAVAGAGVLMGHEWLLTPLLQSEKLVPLPGPRLALDQTLVLTSPHDLNADGLVARLARALTT